MNYLIFLLNDLILKNVAPAPGSGVGQSAGAGSPFSDYTAAVAIYVLAVGALVTGLLITAFLVVNLGMMSKRPEDRVGKRTPSEPGFLKNDVWPEAPYDVNELPAEEEDEEKTKKAA